MNQNSINKMASHFNKFKNTHLFQVVDQRCVFQLHIPEFELGLLSLLNLKLLFLFLCPQLFCLGLAEIFKPLLQLTSSLSFRQKFHFSEHKALKQIGRTDNPLRRVSCTKNEMRIAACKDY